MARSGRHRPRTAGAGRRKAPVDVARRAPSASPPDALPLLFTARMDDGYDPFTPGPLDVAAMSLAIRDSARGRVFPVEVWFPRGADHPLALAAYSHHSGGSRR